MVYRGILKEHAGVLNAALHVVDWLSISLASWVAFSLYLGVGWMPESYLTVVLVTLLLAATLFPRFSMYQAWRGASVLDEVRTISLAWGAVLLGLMFLAFTTKTGATYSRGWLGLWAVSGWVFLIFSRVALRLLLRWARSSGFNQRRVVIVGEAELGGEVIKRIQGAPWIGLKVVGFFSAADEELSEDIRTGLRRGELAEVASFVAEGDVDQVWIAMSLRDEEKLRRLLHELRYSTVDIRYVPDLFGLRLLNHSVMDVAGLPVINLSISPMTGVNRWVKAIEDWFLALIILVLVSPLLLLIAIGVKVTSPGPVLFKQQRYGWEGKLITVYKFRSMVLHHEEGDAVTQAQKNDSRITQIGAFLRRTSLDELPQFFNVLQGRMSIVGPRPHAVAHNEHYKALIDDYMKRHKVKPGITGWAQINGWRGETDTVDKMEKRVEYDLYYIENWSLWFDLKIIFLTVFVGLAGKNAR